MSQVLRNALAHALLFFVIAVVFRLPAAAQPVSERIGELALTIDANRWRFERSAQDVVRVVPVDAMAKTARAVVITQAASKDLTDCEGLARSQLPTSLYVEPTRRDVVVGGVNAVAFSARTRCRNATPLGMVVCVPYRSVGYVLADRIVGCRDSDGNAFSGSDWFEDLIGGIRFTPR